MRGPGLTCYLPDMGDLSPGTNAHDAVCQLSLDDEGDLHAIVRRLRLSGVESRVGSYVANSASSTTTTMTTGVLYPPQLNGRSADKNHHLM